MVVDNCIVQRRLRVVQFGGGGQSQSNRHPQA